MPPIYGYRCVTDTDREKQHRDIDHPVCEHEYEVLYQNAGAVEREEPSETCPKCGGQDKERIEVNTGTSFSLKGKGWAKDRYT